MACAARWRTAFAPPPGGPRLAPLAGLTLTSSSRILQRSSQFRSRRVPPSRASRSSRTSSRRPRTSSSLSRRLSAMASCLFCAAACVRYSVASSVRIAFSCASRCETSGAEEDLESAMYTLLVAGDCPCWLCSLGLVATRSRSTSPHAQGHGAVLDACGSPAANYSPLTAASPQERGVADLQLPRRLGQSLVCASVLAAKRTYTAR